MQLYTSGTLIAGRYQVTRLLGSGGMSAVYEARDIASDTRVALKQNGLPQQRGAWKKAAQRLAVVDHPHLPRIMEVVDSDESQFLAMEYIGGPDLEEVLQAGSDLAATDVLGWADQLLDALAHLHEQRPAIIHGAIRPHHLKLSARGRVILLDVRMLPATSTLATTQRADPYIAPEVQRSGRHDECSDLYAIGATLYRLLAGIPPVDAATRRELVLQQMADPLLPIHETNPQVTPAVAMVVQAALALDPRERPQTAAHTRRLLLQARDGQLPALPARPQSRRWGWRWFGA